MRRRVAAVAGGPDATSTGTSAGGWRARAMDAEPSRLRAHRSAPRPARRSSFGFGFGFDSDPDDEEAYRRRNRDVALDDPAWGGRDRDRDWERHGGRGMDAYDAWERHGTASAGRFRAEVDAFDAWDRRRRDASPTPSLRPDSAIDWETSEHLRDFVRDDAGGGGRVSGGRPATLDRFFHQLEELRRQVVEGARRAGRTRGDDGNGDGTGARDARDGIHRRRGEYRDEYGPRPRPRARLATPVSPRRSRASVVGDAAGGHADDTADERDDDVLRDDGVPRERRATRLDSTAAEDRATPTPDLAFDFFSRSRDRERDGDATRERDAESPRRDDPPRPSSSAAGEVAAVMARGAVHGAVSTPSHPRRPATPEPVRGFDTIASPRDAWDDVEAEPDPVGSAAASTAERSPAGTELGRLLSERPGFSELLAGVLSSFRALPAETLRETCVRVLVGDGNGVFGGVYGGNGAYGAYGVSGDGDASEREPERERDR